MIEKSHSKLKTKNKKQKKILENKIRKMSVKRKKKPSKPK
jgi:hypothetical protein